MQLPMPAITANRSLIILDFPVTSTTAQGTIDQRQLVPQWVLGNAEMGGISRPNVSNHSDALDEDLPFELYDEGEGLANVIRDDAQAPGPSGEPAAATTAETAMCTAATLPLERCV